jgi:Flp pilus assembly protein TadD
MKSSRQTSNNVVRRGARGPKPHFAQWVGLLAAIGASVNAGCAAQRSQDVRANLGVMQRENTWEKLLERGRAFAAFGDHTRGQQYLSLALDAGGDPNVILPVLIRVCVEGERFLAALDYGRAYLKKNPDDARLRFVVASLEGAVGDAAAALAELRLVTEERPEDAEAHFALAALVRDGHGDPYEADRHYREYLRISPLGPHAPEARAALLKAVP